MGCKSCNKTMNVPSGGKKMGTARPASKPYTVKSSSKGVATTKPMQNN